MQSGLTFEAFHPGDRFVTGRRTVTETDIIQFVSLVGLFEPLFLDIEFIKKESLFGERIAPGSLTFGLAEGLTVQTGILHGTGMAFVGLEHMKLSAPVRMGDTIQVEIEVLDTKEVKSGIGGIVRFLQAVTNQRGETVMSYEASRLIRRKNRKVERQAGKP